MAEHSLAPGFVKVNYSVSFTGVAPHRHQQILPIAYADPTPTPGVVPVLVDALGVNVNSPTWETTYKPLVGAFFGTGFEIQSFEYWAKPTPESDPYFVYVSAGGTQPTVTGTNVQAGQAVLTYRTILGSILKLYFMEGKTAITTRDLYPYTAGTPAAGLTNHLVGGASPIIGRDGSQAIAGISYTGKVNDFLRKKYYLDN